MPSPRTGHAASIAIQVTQLIRPQTDRNPPCSAARQAFGSATTFYDDIMKSPNVHRPPDPGHLRWERRIAGCDVPAAPKMEIFRENCSIANKKESGIMSTVAVVGLGYVGLPLAVAFGKKLPTIRFDLSAEKVENYRRHVDPTAEVSGEELRAATRLTVTTDPAQLAAADIIVVAVPTPVDTVRQPDFGPLIGASTTVGKHMKNGGSKL